MPVISTFFGIVIRMFFGDHPPPHFHAEYQGENNVQYERPTTGWEYFIEEGSQADSGVGFASSI